MHTVLMTVFFMAWLSCAGSVEQSCDKPAALAVAIVTAGVACSIAWLLGGGNGSNR